MLKRLFSILTISLILTGSFFSVCIIKQPAFADSESPSGYTQATTRKQLTDAFLAYCKTRDSELTSSVLGGASTFAYSVIQRASQALGINIDDLQANLYYINNSNTGFRWFMTSTGISLFNEIFAYMIQEKGLNVGDENVDEILYSGKQFTDADNVSCLIYILPTTRNGNNDNNKPVYYGTYYTYSTSQLKSIIDNGFRNISFNLTSDVTYNGSLYKSTVRFNNIDNVVAYRGYSSYANLYNWLYGELSDGTVIYRGNYVIAQIPNDNNYYLMLLGQYTSSANLSGSGICWDYLKAFTLSNSSVEPLTINIISNKISNYYEGDTIYNNDGDVINNDYPDPNPNPTPDPPTIPDNGGWQDFTLPEMPNDWLIYGMEKKFPFDIPFNIMFGLSLLNHEPEIPKFEGDIDLKVCNWHYDIDLTPFDDIAKMLRKFEVLAFIIGLAILTKELIMWG